LLLLPRFGVTGAAIAATGSYLLAAFLFLRAFCHAEGCSFREALWVRPRDVREMLGWFSEFRNFGLRAAHKAAIQ